MGHRSEERGVNGETPGEQIMNFKLNVLSARCLPGTTQAGLAESQDTGGAVQNLRTQAGLCTILGHRQSCV